MFKNQKSKILVFLLMLGILYGCKRQILDPLNPQNNLPQKVKLDKVKGFYENGRYKNQPKRTSSNGNERMTAADSARFKDFEPQWDKTVVELLPNNEKMLIVPVVRNLQVNYNQDIGFIRRLCIRVDANDDFLEANIVELVGNLTFVKENHNAIFKDYKENNISGFQGSVIIYELDYDTQVVKYYNQGFFLKNSLPIVYNSDTQRPYPCWMFISYWNEGSCPYGNSGLPAHGTATNCNGGGYWETVGMMGICEDNGGSSGGGYGGGEGSGSNGTGGAGGGSSGSTGTNNPRPRPRTAIRPPQPPNTVWDEECFCWMPPTGSGVIVHDDGISWDANGNPLDAEDLTPCVPTPDEELRIIEFKKIMKITHEGKSLNKWKNQELKFANLLHKLKQRSPLVQKICDRIEAKLAQRGTSTNLKRILIDKQPRYIEHGETDIRTTGPNAGIPFVKSPAVEGIFLEELIHALQYLERNSNVRPTTDEMLHMEFEAKVIGHLILTMVDAVDTWKNQDDRKPVPDWVRDYKKWFAKIKNLNLANFSTTGQFTQAEWNHFIISFATNHAGIYNNLHNPNFVPTRVPTVLFLLFTP